MAYAAAATTAGVSVFALGASAYAEVVYTPVHQQLSPNSSYVLDLNNDGIADFTLLDDHFGAAIRQTGSTFNSFADILLVGAQSSNQALEARSTYGPAAIPRRS